MKREQLGYAAEIINQGGVVAYPTESCFGLGCDPRNNAALRRLLHIKQRSFEQGMIIVGACYHQLKMYIACSQEEVPERVFDSWPGPYTWLLPAHDGVSRWLRGQHSTIAVRVTSHPIAAALCRQTGKAVVSTSANRHGRSPERHAKQVEKQLGSLVDYVLTGSIGLASKPSEIRDAFSGQVLRPA